MKKLVALLLVAVMCLGLVPMASAADTLTEQQKAVVETCKAYYYHNPHIQYDSDPITVMGKYTELLGDIRGTDYTSPEMAVETDVMYSVCSMYCFEVYYDAFGYEILGEPIKSKTSDINNIPADDPIVAYRWKQGAEEYKDITKAQACDEIRKILQPGDVINGGNPSGHAMMYVGDILGDGTNYILHCAGQKFDPQTGNDSIETKGAIRLDPLDPYVLNMDTGLVKGYSQLTILRPLVEINANPSKYPMTESAKARLKYNDLFIDRQANYNKYTDVEVGGEITVSIKLGNKSKGDYTVPVTEIIPANATLKDAGTGKVSGSNITWSVELKAGESKTLTYTVTANGKRGDVIKLEGGNVAGIKSNSIPVKIGGKHLTAEMNAKLANINSQKSLFRKQEYSDTAFAEAVYSQILGIAVDLPTSSEILSTLYTRERLSGATMFMYVRKDEPVPADFQTKYDMMVPYYFGGQLIRTSGSGSGHERVVDFKDHQMVPGDVLVRRITGKTAECYVYIGDGKLAHMDEGALKITNGGTRLSTNLIYDYFVLLRPSLAFDDVKQSVALPFTDVKSGDWYYEFVSEMYGKGVINGMTATTFVPGGNLTYGQALKLIAVGLGKGEQPAGSHWASGYLTLARNEGWLSADVDLNGSVSRLAFCQIAAKAKNLTAQPASNPFTDTADTSVLALVNAGVINGMSATSFQPNGLLTRAQIAKIISLLVKL